MKVSRAFVLVLLAISAGLLVGCANTAATRNPAGLEVNLATKADEGLVLLKVVSTRPISFLNPKWRSIHVKSNVTAHELADITPMFNLLVTNYVPTESLYFARLPAGDYEVTALGSMGAGPGLLLALMMSDRAVATGKLPKFSVKAGRLANLGTIVYSPEIDKQQPARMFVLNGEMGRRAALEDILAESNLAQLQMAEDGGWDALPGDEAPVLAQARKLVSMLTLGTGAKPDSGMIAGSHLGQIFQRAGPRKWNTESLNTLSRISATTRMADGTLLAGADYGRYFVSGPGRAFRQGRLGNEKGRIIHIEARPDGSALFVTVSLRESRVHLVKSLKDASEVPTLVATVPWSVTTMLTQSDSIILAWNEPGISRETHITRIDKQSLAVSRKTEKFWVVNWQYLPNGQLVMTRMNGLSLYRSTSPDNLRTWVHTETAGQRSSIWDDADNATSMDFSSGVSTVTNFLLKTFNGGKTWERFGAPVLSEVTVGQLLYADKDELLVHANHVVLSSVDRGQTWKQILPPRP